MADAATARVDAFTDAAFAFAVTLFVAGAGGGQVDSDVLAQTVASIPSFAIGFAIIAMFWVAHIRWRAVRGAGDWRSLILTLLLVFVALIYVVPLRAMAASLAAFVRGTATGSAREVSTLFIVYGIGFATMALVTALLFRDALRNAGLAEGQRKAVLGQVWIWAILAWTGAVSTILATLDATWWIAPWAYATLPVTIGIFAARWDWGAAPDPASDSH